MSALIPYLTITKPFGETLAWTTQQLNEIGLQVEQTFDLQVARLPHTGCSCPHHGTHECSCQMVVLLVCAEGNDTLTLILHGTDGQTNLSLVNFFGKRMNSNLDAVVRRALDPQDRETELGNHEP